jgi:RimJ/RimL family protein N-acetyltransferase
MAATAGPTRIEAADRRRGIAALMLAFAADPVMRWFWPDASRYATGWPAFAEAFGGRAFEHGTACGLDDCAAVALWLPPGIGPDEEAFIASISASVDPRLLEQADPFFEQMDHHHPSADHWYLPLMGVDVVAQGRGLGSALLRRALETCDRDQLPAYLEATSPRSRDLYQRHGFDVIGEITADPVPPMWAMLRKPATRAGSG